MAYTIELPGVFDERGNLRWVESGIIVPFEIKRVFYMTDVPPQGISRGGHAHRKCHQFIILASGGMNVDLDYDGQRNTAIYLRSPNVGFHVPPLVWCTLTLYPSTVCIVLASELYDENDYIRDYSTFLEEVKK